MIGLPAPAEDPTAKPILRAYSIASPNFADELEFFSIKVADGPLTSRLQKIKVGDAVLMGRKPTGTLVLDALKPGKRLIMFATGTGLAPFLSVARDPETYERFDKVVVTHGVRQVAELAGVPMSTMSRHMLDLSAYRRTRKGAEEGNDNARARAPGLGLVSVETPPDNMRERHYTLTQKGRGLLNVLETILSADRK
jgi:ferredoxin-NADP reductase